MGTLAAYSKEHACVHDVDLFFLQKSNEVIVLSYKSNQNYIYPIRYLTLPNNYPSLRGNPSLTTISVHSARWSNCIYSSRVDFEFSLHYALDHTRPISMCQS